MFAPAHLRAPRRDRAILTGSLVALAGAAWLALWAWEGSPYGHYLHHAGDGGPLPLEAALFARRLAADDRGDDAALERPAGA